MMFDNIYKDKTVCITGHTGFKGSWLSEWLLLLGAKVVGYAQEPPTVPSLFAQFHLEKRLTADIRGDVRDLDRLHGVLREYQPDFLFHLAAQPIVRLAFKQPVDTIATNVMGSVHVLEALRRENRGCVVVMITTDKVYENTEWVHAYREVDALGGYDPYSASKGCAEMVISAYRRSFFSKNTATGDEPVIAVASARAGNVIGGGDWALDRIVPDCMRSLASDHPIPIRNKTATRPWQHVLEPLSGYLLLGQEIFRALHGPHRNLTRLHDLCSPFNFGPTLASNKTVLQLVQEILKHWPGAWQDQSDPDAPYEAERLYLSLDKAFHLLGWHPRWTFAETIRHTVEWYLRHSKEPEGDASDVMGKLTQEQILSYTSNLSIPNSG